jgi:hypothetical protein
MQFSKTAQLRSQNPKFHHAAKYDDVLHIHLNKLNCDLIMSFKTHQAQELMLIGADYQTNYQGQYLGVIDAFFELIQNRAVEAIDRFPIKELDHYLRDEPTASAFSGYSQELYDILSIGEQLKNKIYGKKEIKFTYDVHKLGNFMQLSTSEQFEWMEEFFSHYVFGKITSLEKAALLDVQDQVLVFNFADPELFKLIRTVFQLEDCIVFKSID